jgi:hypothetical protein
MPTSVIVGPCIVKWNNIVFFTKGDVKVEMSRQLTEIPTDQFGLVDQRHKSSVIKVSFTPCGRYQELSALITYVTGKSPGQSLVPAGAGNEKSLVIQPIYNAGGASRIWTFLRSGPTAIGASNVSATKTAAGEVTFTCLVSTVTPNTSFTTAVFAAPASGDMDDLSKADIIMLPAEAVWANDPGTLASGDLVMTSMDGWTIDLGLKTKEHEREAVGIADITLTDVVPSISGEAANIFDHTGALLGEHSWAPLMPFMTILPGQSATRKTLNLRALHNDGVGGATVAGTADVLFTFPLTEMDMQGLSWGAETNRTGRVSFKSIPTFTTGVRNAPVTPYAL